MTALDDKIIPKVQEIIDKYGISVTFEVSSSDSYDRTTGLITKTETTYTVTVSPPSPFDERRIDGTIIRRGDLMVILPTSDLSFTPDFDQKVTIGSLEYTVQVVNPIYSGASIAAYELGLRR